ncbi:MAG TPA: DUF3160 domain-containing protein [Fibrobacteria bacterium]|nr:DUF3160 domain-containing protein [Fibrobacteria bacterium]HOX50031.1 DUF3160 domain-containing protein [Fibrobacteria bacterium]
MSEPQTAPRRRFSPVLVAVLAIGLLGAAAWGIWKVVGSIRLVTTESTGFTSSTDFLALFQGPPDTLPSYLAPYHQNEEFRFEFPKDVPPPRMDTSLDLSKFSLEQVRYLRAFVLARHGKLFDDMVLRNFFGRFSWYQPIWEPLDFQPRLAPWEQRWHDKLFEREEALRKDSWHDVDGIRQGRTSHLVNGMMFDTLPGPLLARLDSVGFAVVGGNHRQLWHVYDQNQYRNVPSLVTTDLYLQLLHMHFKYLVRTVEREKLIPGLRTTLADLRGRIAQPVPPSMQEGRIRAEAGIALAQAFLDRSEAPLATLDPSIRENALDDYRSGTASKGQASQILQDTLMDWTAFKPRGHYESSDTLAGYFRAVKWLGLARWKLDGPNVPAALALAQAWSAAGDEGTRGLRAIGSFADLASGPSNGLSPADLVAASGGRNLTELSSDPAALATLLEKTLARDPVRIRGKGANPIAEKDLETPFVRVFPLRWSADAEILQRLIEVKDKLRPYPSGLDVFAVRKAGPALEILRRWDSSTTTWEGWKDTLEVLQRTPELSGGTDFHSRRMRLNLTLFDVPARSAGFQKTALWQRQRLVANLAAWTLQKQENILYQEQAFAAEAGEGGGPPPPDPKGWVEPNVEFWDGAAELIRQLDTSLAALGMKTSLVASLHKEFLSDLAWLADASRRELAGQNPTKEQLESIDWIGGRMEQLTGEISGIQPGQFESSEEGMAAAAVDVYAFNGKPLMEGTGFADELWAVVELGGFLHLVRGAVFSHREWQAPERLTDTEWHKMLESGKAPARPSWQDPLFVDVPSPVGRNRPHDREVEPQP